MDIAARIEYDVKWKKRKEEILMGKTRLDVLLFEKGIADSREKAKTIIMVRRKVYLGLIILVSVWTLYASELTMTFKIIATITAALVGVFLWFFLSQRRHFISRDATEIEDKLSR